MGKASRRKIRNWPAMTPEQLAVISHLERTGQFMCVDEDGSVGPAYAPAGPPSDAECVRLCSLESYFADDVTDCCSTCGRTVYIRPYGDRGMRLICAKCGEAELGRAAIEIAMKGFSV